MPLMLAWWFQKREGQLRPLDFLVAGVLLAVPVGLIVKQPDLGTALLVLAAGMSVIFFAGLSWKLVAPPLLLGLIGITLLVLFEPELCADGVNWPGLRLSAAAYLHAAGPDPRPAWQRLSHHPGHDRHWLRRLLG